jgi:hypothetical protein
LSLRSGRAPLSDAGAAQHEEKPRRAGETETMANEIETDIELLPLSDAGGDWAQDFGEIFAQPRLNKVPSPAWLEQLKQRTQQGLEAILAKLKPRIQRQTQGAPFEQVSAIDYVKDGNRLRYLTYPADAEQLHQAVKRLVAQVNHSAHERNEATARAIEGSQRARAEQNAVLRELAKKMEGK